MSPEQEEYKDFIKMLSVFIIGLIAIGVAVTMCSCTISFQNISTHGTATDLVTEDQSADPDIKSDVTVPAKVI